MSKKIEKVVIGLFLTHSLYHSSNRPKKGYRIKNAKKGLSFWHHSSFSFSRTPCRTLQKHLTLKDFWFMGIFFSFLAPKKVSCASYKNRKARRKTESSAYYYIETGTGTLYTHKSTCSASVVMLNGSFAQREKLIIATGAHCLVNTTHSEYFPNYLRIPTSSLKKFIQKFLATSKFNFFVLRERHQTYKIKHFTVSKKFINNINVSDIAFASAINFGQGGCSIATRNDISKFQTCPTGIFGHTLKVANNFKFNNDSSIRWVGTYKVLARENREWLSREGTVQPKEQLVCVPEAPFVPGWSGGAILDDNNNLIGVVTSLPDKKYGCWTYFTHEQEEMLRMTDNLSLSYNHSERIDPHAINLDISEIIGLFSFSFFVLCYLGCMLFYLTSRKN